MFLVAQLVGKALNDAKLVVESFDEAQGDLALGATVSGSQLSLPALGN